MRRMIRPGFLLGAVVGGILAASDAPALAVEALSFPYGTDSGYAFTLGGGYGWSFVPTTNIMVTSVGYLATTAGGNPNAVVTIWAGTNTVIASYSGIPAGSAQAGDVVYAAVSPLTLTAGQPYSIMAYTAPLSGSMWYGALFDNSGMVVPNATFQVAPALTQYQARKLNQDGTFGPPPADPSMYQQVLFLGPTFTYEIGSARPILTIAPTNNNSVVLTWPTNAAGFVLQSSLVVTGTYANVTNSRSVAGVNYTTILPHTNAASFFRLRKQS